MKGNFLVLGAFICLTGLLFVNCTDKDYYDGDKDPNHVDDRPSTFDFSTSQEVKLVLNYDIPEGFVSPFKLYTENPMKNGELRTDLTPIASGINISGTSNLKRTIPSYVNELYLYSGSMFVPLLSYARIENGIAQFQLADAGVGRENGTRAGNAGTFWKTPISHFLKKKADYYTESIPESGIYKFDLIEPDYQKDIPVEILNAISTTFVEKEIVDEKYYKDATIKVQKGMSSDTGAEVFVSILHSGAGMWNSLSYFVYTGDKELTELPKAEVEALEVINIFQYADVYNNTVMPHKKNIGLTPGKYVQLLYRNEKGELVKEFPVGAQIGWILHPGGFDSGNFTVKDNEVRLFSVSEWNDPNNKTKDPNIKTNNYNIFFSATDNNGDTYNCFGFEDKPKLDSDGDCNDVVFHVHTNPADAIVPPPSITEEDVEEIEPKKGILAFEDNWPKKGDYDLNDVVVKYSSNINYLYKKKTQDGTVIQTTDVMVKKVEDTFSFIHNGASYQNAFSYKINVPASAVEKITVVDGDGQITDFTNKIVADGDGFIVDLCKNVKDIIKEMVYDVNPYIYTVTIEFKEGMVLQDEFAELAAPYNPFISPKETPGAEIHLAMYPPTGRVDPSLFSTSDDRSDMKNIWYVSGENVKFPFAINLVNADKFKTPVETEPIYSTYPKYLDWVNSGMTDFKNWYK